MRHEAIVVEVRKPDGSTGKIDLRVRELTAGELRQWRNKTTLFRDELLTLAGIDQEVVDAMWSTEVARVYDLIWELSGFPKAAAGGGQEKAGN